VYVRPMHRRLVTPCLRVLCDDFTQVLSASPGNTDHDESDDDDDADVDGWQCKRGMRSSGRASVANRSPRRRRHLLRVLQNNARLEIRE